MPWNNQLRSRYTSCSLDCLEVGGSFRSDVYYFWNLRQRLDCDTACVKIVSLWAAAKYLVVGYKAHGSCGAVQRVIQFHFIALWQLVIWRNRTNCHRFIFFYAFATYIYIYIYIYIFKFCNIIQLSVDRISVIFRERQFGKILHYAHIYIHPRMCASPLEAKRVKQWAQGQISEVALS